MTIVKAAALAVPGLTRVSPGAGMTAHSFPGSLRAIALAVAALVAPYTSRGEDPAIVAGPLPDSAPEDLVQAAPPPFSEGIFPCSQCHDGKGDRTKRVLGFHEDVQARFAHQRSRRWCLGCHDFEDRDALHLSGGERIPFAKSYALCAQCHYAKYRDWRLGIHGKRVGRWEGPKTYLLCVHCHDPHEPAVKPIAPERGPRPPKETRR